MVSDPNAKENRLLTQPKRICKIFNLHDFDTNIIFEKGPVGQNLIDNCCSLLCEIVRSPENYTNHSIRASAITYLKEMGFDIVDIMKQTGKFKIILVVKSMLFLIAHWPKADFILTILFYFYVFLPFAAPNN